MNLPILLVDDDPDACAIAGKLLWKHGYQFDVAYDAPSALDLVEQRRYALAIIDYRMPGMNGVELFRHMRRLQSDLPAILLTGVATLNVVYPAVTEGIIRLVPKPANWQELLPFIDEFVGSPSCRPQAEEHAAVRLD